MYLTCLESLIHVLNMSREFNRRVLHFYSIIHVLNMYIKYNPCIEKSLEFNPCNEHVLESIIHLLHMSIEYNP